MSNNIHGIEVGDWVMTDGAKGIYQVTEVNEKTFSDTCVDGQRFQPGDRIIFKHNAVVLTEEEVKELAGCTFYGATLNRLKYRCQDILKPKERELKELFLCPCREFYQSHHSDCRANVQYKNALAALDGAKKRIAELEAQLREQEGNES